VGVVDVDVARLVTTTLPAMGSPLTTVHLKQCSSPATLPQLLPDLASQTLMLPV